MTFLQVDIKYRCFFFFLTDFVLPEEVVLNVTILFIANRPSENKIIEEKLVFPMEKNGRISNNKEEISLYADDYYVIRNYLEEYDIEEIKILVTEIGIREPVSNDDTNYNELYNIKINLGDNADSNKQPNIDFTLYLSQNNYFYCDINLYKIQEISSCNSEYKFNITLDKNIEEIEEKINITLKRKGVNKNSYMNAECILSSENNNIIPCKIETEILNYNFSFSLYIQIVQNETKIISIIASDDFIFSLFCYEKPPVFVIIIYSSIFAFIIILVIVTVIFLNKKRRGGEKEYDSPNKNNSKNLIALSSGFITK